MISWLNVAIGAILLYFFVLAIFKEREMLGCQNGFSAIFLNNPTCDNINTNVVNSPDPLEEMVVWRRAYILAFAIIFIYNCLLFQSLRVNINTFFGIMVATFFIYFSTNFYHYHLYRHVLAKAKENC